MSFVITERAFRFTVGTKAYALDVFNDGLVYDAGTAVHLLHETAQGWHRAHAEMEPVLYVTQALIDAEGGIVPLCQIIVEKVNRALALIHGGDVVLPPSTLPHEQVADYLRQNLQLTTVNGVPQLSLGGG